MDHKYINEFDLVERYLMGRLAAHESAQFEEHFVDCAQCLDQLNVTKGLMEGLRLVASARTVEAGAQTPNVGYHPRKTGALAAVVVSLLVLAGGVFLFNQIRGARAEAGQARSASNQWELRYEEERQSAAITERGHQESARELTEQVAQLRAELADVRKQGAAAMAQVNIPIFVLNATRGSGPLAGSINELPIPNSSTSFVISLSLEGETGYRSYVMTILGSRNQLIRKVRGVKPNRDKTISVGFNSTLFRPGYYLLTLDGVARDRSTSVVGKYPFRVLKTQ